MLKRFGLVAACVLPLISCVTPNHPVAIPQATAPQAAAAPAKENFTPAQLKAMQTRTFEGIKKESLMKVIENVATEKGYGSTAMAGGPDKLVMHNQVNGATPADVVFRRLTAQFDPISDKVVEVRLILTRDYFDKANNMALVTAEPEVAAYHKEFFDAIRVEIERRKAMGRK